MLTYKLFPLYVAFAIQRFTVVRSGTKQKHGLFHKKVEVERVADGKTAKRFNFHPTQNIDDLVRNPSALNRDELSEINKLDNLNDMFMNPEVTSETQDLARQGLDPGVAMQISKIDHNLGDILGPKRANQPKNIAAKQKGEILAGYGEQYNPDGSVSMTNNEWPEYQMKDTPPVMSTRPEGLNSMLLGNGNANGLQQMGGGNNSPQVSPQAALNPNLLPGQKSDLGLGMGVGMDKSPISPPMMQSFVKDVADGKSMNKQLLNAPFEKPEIKNAGFRIPGEFSFTGEGKSLEKQEETNFVKNFMGSKKSHTARRKTTKKWKQ